MSMGIVVIYCSLTTLQMMSDPGCTRIVKLKEFSEPQKLLELDDILSIT